MRRYLIAGLLVWVPLGFTLLVLSFLVNLADRTLLLIPPDFRPDAVLGTHIPGLGIILTMAVLLVTGFLAANYFGRALVGFAERVVERIPLVSSLYRGAKQVMETVLSGSGKSFRKVLLVEYPRKGMWSLAFQTSDQPAEVQSRTARDVICVFVPTTPNPTSGFLIMVPREDAQELDMSVDEALRMIISLGVVVPPWKPGETPAEPLAGPEGSP